MIVDAEDEVKVEEKQAPKKLVKTVKVKKKKKSELDLKEEDKEDESDIDINKAEIKSANQSDFGKRDQLKLYTKQQQPTIVVDLDPKELYIHNPNVYNIKAYDFCHPLYYFSFVDTDKKEKKCDIRDMKQIDFIYAVNDFMKKNKKLTSKRKKVIDIWLEAYGKNYPTIDFSNLQKDIPISSDLAKEKVKEYHVNSLKMETENVYNEAFDKLLSRTKDPFTKHKIKLNLYYTDVKFFDNDYKLDVDYDAYFEDEIIDNKMKNSLRNSPNLIYHPYLIGLMIKHAYEHDLENLYFKAENFILEYYKEFEKKLIKRIIQKNGSSDVKLISNDYSSYNKVKPYTNNGSLTDIENVKSFRDENKLKGISGYVKYIDNDEKGSYVTLSYDDLDQIIGKTKRIKLIQKIRKVRHKDKESYNINVERSKFSSIYKKSKVRKAKISDRLRKRYFRLGNDCFYKALGDLNLKRSVGRLVLNGILRNKEYEEQVKIYNEFFPYSKLSIGSTKEMILGEIERELKKKCIVVFSDNGLKSHTIAFKPNCEITDETYLKNAKNLLQVTVIDIN